MGAAPRIVFFGMPHTGKTGLLHAFADPEAPFPLSKYGDEKPAADLCRTRPDGVVLCDVDGRSAKEIITDPAQIRRQDQTASTVRSADAIVLALDASATNEAMIDLFRSFAAFLDGLEETRTHGREVGGLPIFLTLTKCDRLHEFGEDPKAWLARVEAKKRSVQTAFEDYLARTGHATNANDPLAFGSVEVHVAATALQFPKDTRFDALDAPFGVEDLQEDCTKTAWAFRRRIDGSRRQLRWTLAGSGALVTAMAAALVGLFAFSPTADEDRLGRRVRLYQEREGPPAVRLAQLHFDRNRKELESIREDHSFAELSENERAFVEARLREYAAYHDYQTQFLPPRPGPAEVRRKAELEQLDAELSTILVPPPEFAAVWADTEAVKLWNKWKADANLVRTAEGALHEWYRGLVRRGTTLLLAPGIDYRWRQEANALLAAAEQPPFDPVATIPGSEKLPVPRGAAVRYAVAFDFDRVDQARGDWNDTKGRVTAMRDLGDALGLTAGPNTPPAVLIFPDPTADLTASARLGAEVLAKLPAAEWFVSRFPDPMRTTFQNKLRQSQEAGARHVHAVLRAKLGTESREAWAAAAKWFDEPDAKAWGQLLGRIASWGEFDAGDPVAEAVAFLKKDSFALDFTNLELTIPNDLRDRRLVPNGPLAVRHKGAEYAFRVVGEPTTTAAASVFRLAADGHDGKLTYRPGDELSAALALKAGDRSFRLDWSYSGSTVYQFDALAREPTLRPDAATAVAERAAGVRLTAAGLPRLPLVLRINN
jgi:hypothetical protein